jgi:hypothetical protein
MRSHAREALVLLGLSASVALAGCSFTERLGEASAESLLAEPDPRPPQSIAPNTKVVAEKPKKIAQTSRHSKQASAIKPRSIDPIVPAEPKSAEPKPTRPLADPVDRLPSLYPSAPAAGTFSH